MNRSSGALTAAIGCTLGAVADPAICGPLLTDDFNQYWGTAILCVVQNGGAEAVDACFSCLKTQEFGTLDVCPADATDMTTVLRSQCADVCLLDKCETAIQAAALCSLGAPRVFETGMGEEGFHIGGEIAGPDFACPPVS